MAPLSLLLLEPSNIPPSSIINLAELTFPVTFPSLSISRVLHSISPITSPQITTLSARMLPLISPVLPIDTPETDWIFPISLPSILRLHSVIMSPLIFEPFAIVVVP